MQSFQIVGTYTFRDNIVLLKLGDKIKLISNPDNKQNPKSIGVYTNDMIKIGYLPFNSDVIKDLNIPCTITKLTLAQNNATIIISRYLPELKFLVFEPNIIRKTRNREKVIDMNDEVLKFKKYLERNMFIIKHIEVIYKTDDFVDLYIMTDTNEMVFETVTRKYYDMNIMRYEEFTKNKLINETIYQPFKIHRLEKYIMLNYDLIIPLKSLPLPFETKIHENNNTNISLDIMKVIIKYMISKNDIYKHNENSINFNMEYFKDFKVSEIAYSHDIMKYCHIDMYDDNRCIIIDDNIHNYSKIHDIIKPHSLIVYNPYNGYTYSIKN
jgi:hypothetical protein